MDGTSNKPTLRIGVENKVEQEPDPAEPKEVTDSPAISQAEQRGEQIADQAIEEEHSSSSAAPHISATNQVTFFMDTPGMQIKLTTDLRPDQIKKLINGAPKTQRFVCIPSPTNKGTSEELNIQLDKVVVWSCAKFNDSQSKIIRPDMGTGIIK